MMNKKQDPKTSKESTVFLLAKRQHRKHSNFKKQEIENKQQKQDPKLNWKKACSEPTLHPQNTRTAVRITFGSQAETKTTITTQPTITKQKKQSKQKKRRKQLKQAKRQGRFRAK